MPAQPPDNVWDKLKRAANAVDPNNPDGPHQLQIGGTVNILGGGSGGTAQTDDSAFIPASSSLTPIGAYVGGRQVASGNAGAPAMSASAILQVHVVAGGAGGGLANLTVRGTANNDVNVGVASGAAGAAGNWNLPVVLGSGYYPTVNIGNIATVNVGVLPGVVGSVGVTPLATFTVALDKIPTVNLGLGTVNVGALPALTGSFRSTNLGGSVGVVGAGGSLGAVNLGGSVGVSPIGDFTVWLANAAAGSGFATVGVYGSVGVVGSVNVTPVASFTVNLASHIDTAGSAVRVNVVAGGAGGGVAQIQVQGTSGAFAGVGYASGPGDPRSGPDGHFALPVLYASGFYATVNVGAMPALVGSVFVTNLGGSVGVLGLGGSFPVVGSVNVTPVATFTVSLDKIATVNLGLGTVNIGNVHGVVGSVYAIGLGGSMGVTQIGAPWGVVGSVNVTPVASFTVNLGSIPTVNLGLGTVNVGNAHGIFGSVLADTRIGLTMTQWSISFGGSGYSAISIASTSANVRTKLTSIVLVNTATADISFQSPSGTFLTGSLRILPGAGFAQAGVLGHPILIGGANATLFVHSTGTQNIGGWALGYIEA